MKYSYTPWLIKLQKNKRRSSFLSNQENVSVSVPNNGPWWSKPCDIFYPMNKYGRWFKTSLLHRPCSMKPTSNVWIQRHTRLSIIYVCSYHGVHLNGHWERAWAFLSQWEAKAAYVEIGIMQGWKWKRKTPPNFTIPGNLSPIHLDTSVIT